MHTDRSYESLCVCVCVCVCVCSLLLQDFEEYPEHRTHFFYLLQAVNSQCFPAFLSIPPAQFKLVLDSIIWAFKHTMRNVADTGQYARVAHEKNV